MRQWLQTFRRSCLDHLDDLFIFHQFDHAAEQEDMRFIGVAFLEDIVARQHWRRREFFN